MINNPANSLEFWQKVKADFESNTDEAFLCYASETFKSEWHSGSRFREQCCSLANQFLQETNNKYYLAPRRGAVLFNNTGLLSEIICCSGAPKTYIEMSAIRDEYIRRIRTEFIDWRINKLETK